MSNDTPSKRLAAMRRLNESHNTKQTEKTEQRREIEEATQKFLAAGGVIERVDHTANKSYKEELKRLPKIRVGVKVEGDDEVD